MRSLRTQNSKLSASRLLSHQQAVSSALVLPGERCALLNKTFSSTRTFALSTRTPFVLTSNTSLLIPIKRDFHSSLELLQAGEDNQGAQGKEPKKKKKKLKKKKPKFYDDEDEEEELREEDLDQETLMKMAAEPASIAIQGPPLSEELQKEGVEVIRLGEGAEGAFVKLDDSLRCLDVLERRKFLIEFADVWPDKDSALYTDALHSIEMGQLYLKYTGEQLVSECVAKVRKSLKKVLEIKDPAKRGNYVSFGLIEKGSWFPPDQVQL